MARGFVHLHNHTEYSLLDAAQKVPDLVRRAKEFAMPAVAITDHGNLFGAVEFYQCATKEGIKPILGCEAYVAPVSRLDRSPIPGVRKKPYHHLVLLAETSEGFRNLIRLASYAYLEGFYHRPRIDKDLLRRYGRGLIGMSACMSGEIPSYIRAGDMAGARRALDEFLEIFGAANFYLELQDQGIPEEQQINAGLLELHRDTGVPLVVTNDAHYLCRDDQAAHDVLVCIGTGKKRDEPERVRYTQEHYFKSAEEMRERFAWCDDALDNTLAVADRCDVRIDTSQHHLPAFPVAEGEHLDDVFRRQAWAGFAEREVVWTRRAEAGELAHPLADYRARLERELEMIVAMGFAGYFLIVWDFIRHARERGIPVGPGRGSAAGSLVAYCLKITDIDPLDYDLLFERFLNPERITLPDIDIDFCFRRRQEVIDYVTAKYGRENVAQIITFGTMAARAAIRDAGRVLGLPYGEVDRIAKLVPEEVGARLEDAIKTVPGLAQIEQSGGQGGELLEVALRLEGLARHASTHAAGVVITPRPVMEFAPLFRSNKDEITTQWAMGDIESIGLLKMDFLGLKTLTLIADALELIEGATGDKLDLAALPLTDAETFALFGRGDTSGVFQFESSGMRDILRRMKPEKFEDLIALNALYRPGPLGSGMIEDFIQRRHGRTKVSFPHPLLEPLLRPTYGVIVYQEQVMQIASVMAGYSLGQADLLRRAMGKKKKEVMQAERERFVAGAAANQVARADAERVFDLMEHFAGYGFNKSHSAAYALVAYHTAYLKAHYPVPFMAALLTTERDNTDKLVEYVAEGRGRGVAILPPDIQRSGHAFGVEGSAVRFGLSAVKGVGEATVEAIEAARRAGAPFGSLDDLCRRVDRRVMNRRALEALVKSGALDAFGERARLVAGIEEAMERAARVASDRSSGQVSLFGDEIELVAAAPPLPDAPPWSDRERLAGEKEALGFYLSGHPLDAHVDLLDDVTTHRLAGVPGTGEVVVGGLVTGLKRRRTKAGDWMAVFTLEDMSASVECVVFPKLYRECGEALADDQAIVIRARADAAEGDVRLFVEDVKPLTDAPSLRTQGLTLRLEARGDDPSASVALARLAELLADHPGDAPLFFEVVRAGDYRVVLEAEPGRRVRADRALLQRLDDVLGAGSARLGRPA